VYGKNNWIKDGTKFLQVGIMSKLFYILQELSLATINTSRIIVTADKNTEIIFKKMGLYRAYHRLITNFNSELPDINNNETGLKRIMHVFELIKPKQFTKEAVLKIKYSNETDNKTGSKNTSKTFAGAIDEFLKDNNVICNDYFSLEPITIKKEDITSLYKKLSNDLKDESKRVLQSATIKETDWKDFLKNQGNMSGRASKIMRRVFEEEFVTDYMKKVFNLKMINMLKTFPFANTMLPLDSFLVKNFIINLTFDFSTIKVIDTDDYNQKHKDPTALIRLQKQLLVSTDKIEAKKNKKKELILLFLMICY
jgi:hypothetical protein